MMDATERAFRDKETRIKYQDIVYAICTQLEIAGRVPKDICGVSEVVQRINAICAKAELVDRAVAELREVMAFMNQEDNSIDYAKIEHIIADYRKLEDGE